MKTTREQLKSIIKELLIEILQEGLNVSNAETMRTVIPENRRKQSHQSSLRKQSFDSRLDTPVGNRTPTNALKEAVRIESGGNSVLADILADTAMTTLPTQLSHGDKMGRPSAGVPGPSLAQQEQFNGDPTEIFVGGSVRNDGSSHWADLAFT